MKNRSHRRHDKGTLLLRLLRLIANEPILMILLCIWMVIAILGIVVLSHRLETTVGTSGSSSTLSNVVIPDLRYMGYSSQQLYNEFYNVIGAEGCRIYSTLALWDICILLPAYTFVLGTIYVHVARYSYDKMGSVFSNQQIDRGYWNADRRAYLIVPIALFDFIETSIQRRGCTLLLQQPSPDGATVPSIQFDHLSNLQVRIASIAVSMKWSLLVLFCISIVERLYRGYFVNSTQLQKQLPQ